MIKSKQVLKVFKDSYYDYWKQSTTVNNFLKTPVAIKITSSPVSSNTPTGISKEKFIKETLVSFFKDPFIKELVEEEKYDALFDNFNNAIVKNSNYIQLSDLSKILLKADIDFIPKLNHIEDSMFANIDLNPYQSGILAERKTVLFKEALNTATEILYEYSKEDIDILKSVMEGIEV